MELTNIEKEELKYLLEVAIEDTKDTFRLENSTRTSPDADAESIEYNTVACKESLRLLQIYRDIYHKIGS